MKAKKNDPQNLLIEVESYRKKIILSRARYMDQKHINQFVGRRINRLESEG